MKKFVAIVLALFMILGITACGSKEVAQPVSSGTSTGKTEAASSEVVFNYSVNFEETNWDPAYWTAPDDTGLGSVIYEPLFEYQADGSLKPALALSYEISDDNLVYTINLRQGVKWQKGFGEFTSEDVKFTIERQTDPEIASINGKNLNVDNIASVECPDPYTVVITLKSIDVDFLTRLSMFYFFIVCKAYSDKEGKAALNVVPVGTGAFEYESGTLAAKTEAVANKEWWGDREGGNIDRLVCTYIADENTNFAAFENGELDILRSSNLDKTREYVGKGFIDVQSPKRFTEILARRIEKSPNIEVKLNFTVTPEFIRENDFDDVIIAIGAKPIRPDIPGIDNPKVVLATEIHERELGQNLVFIGGGMVGCEEGIFAAKYQGKNVTIVEMTDKYGKGAPFIHWLGMTIEMEKLDNLNMMLESPVAEITDKGVRVKAANGTETEIPADSVIVGVGMESLTEQAWELYNASNNAVIVGDAQKPARMNEAVAAGYYAGFNIQRLDS